MEYKHNNLTKHYKLISMLPPHVYWAVGDLEEVNRRSQEVSFTVQYQPGYLGKVADGYAVAEFGRYAEQRKYIVNSKLKCPLPLTGFPLLRE